MNEENLVKAVQELVTDGFDNMANILDKQLTEIALSTYEQKEQIESIALSMRLFSNAVVAVMKEFEIKLERKK